MCETDVWSFSGQGGVGGWGVVVDFSFETVRLHFECVKWEESHRH